MILIWWEIIPKYPLRIQRKSSKWEIEFILTVSGILHLLDGLLSFTVLERGPNCVKTRVDNNGMLGENNVSLLLVL